MYLSRATSLLLPLLLTACAGTEPSKPAAPTAQEVWKNVKYSTIFSVTPDANGHLNKCAFAGASDPRDRSPKGRDVAFRPSDAYIKEACDTLAKGRWSVERDADGNIEPRYDFCYYSTVIPDSPVCDAKLSQGDQAKP